jgi:1,2-diacylglycerol 3-beta-galactosyltransferase
MTPLQPDQPHILFLFSDTGGGHRSASEAIIEAINQQFPNQITTEMVDLFRQYAPPPLDRAPEIYPPLSRMPDLWRLGYHAVDSQRRTRIVSNIVWPYIRRSIHRLLEDHPCDLIVSVHPLMNTPILRMLGKREMPFITVVTDMVSTHSFWYDPRADMVIVPTEKARERAIENEVAGAKIRVVGLPVSAKFCEPQGNNHEIRQSLGWPDDLPIVLLVGGGEGMGPLEKTAHAIEEARLPVRLVIVAGRNRSLRNRLENHPWRIPVLIYGFIRDMPRFMRAADILVSKAGPGTISEAFIAGLPIILYSKMPGQEDGNVDYVVQEGAGKWAPDPADVVEGVCDWLRHPSRRRAAVEACNRLARPDAALMIATLLAEKVGIRQTVDPG